MLHALMQRETLEGDIMGDIMGSGRTSAINAGFEPFAPSIRRTGRRPWVTAQQQCGQGTRRWSQQRRNDENEGFQAETCASESARATRFALLARAHARGRGLL